MTTITLTRERLGIVQSTVRMSDLLIDGSMRQFYPSFIGPHKLARQ